MISDFSAVWTSPGEDAEPMPLRVGVRMNLRQAAPNKAAGRRPRGRWQFVLCVVLTLLATMPICSAASGGLHVQTSTTETGRVTQAAPLALPDVSPSAPARWSALADTIFQQVGNDQGFSHQVTTALAEDGDGFLWVGTQGGLARWDGYRLRTFLFDPKDPNALPDNNIQTLHTDRDGRLWIGTSSGGLVRYDREHERFTTIAVGPTGLSHVLVWAITDDGSGGIWVGTAGGLDHIAPNKTVSHLRHDPADSGSLPDSNVRALLFDRHGTLWVGTRKGLVRRAAGAHRFEAVTLETSSAVPLSVISLCESGDGQIWVGTRNNGAYVVDLATGQAHALVKSGPAAATPATEMVYAIAEVRPGVVWLGTYGQGILEINSASGQTRRLLHDATLSTSLADNTVLALHRDHAGLVWVASNSGLSRHDPAQTAILTLFGATARANGVSDADVTSVLPTADGRVWLGLHNMGVDVLDPSLGRVAALQPNPAWPRSALPKRHVVSLAESGNGDVFIATGAGLYRADRGATHVARVVWPGRDPATSADAIMLDDSKLWVGSRDDGAWHFDPKSRSAVRPPGMMALSDQRVNLIARASAGAWWLGTLNGLNRYDPANERVETILPQANGANGLTSGFVGALLTDHQGRLWVGTLGGGIDILESRDADGRPRFRRLGMAQGLPNANISQLLEDRSGQVWASTDDGLAVIDPSSFVVRALHRADGVAIPAYWSNSGAVTPQGELLFGGRGGLTVVRPERLRVWDYRPPVVVTEARIGGQLVAVGGFNGGEATTPLSVSPEGNSLAVEFAALDYSAPELNRYAYQLEGYDRDWITTDASRRLAAYTNLPPGDYHLRLRGSNRAGVWTEKLLTLPIRVLPAWYQTLWFRVLLVLLALTCVFGLVRWRTAALRQRQRELEQTVAQRTEALTETNKNLHHANAELAQASDTLRELGEVGREITANLEAQAVFASLYRHVDSLLDASTFSIYRLNAQGTALVCAFGREDGQAVLARTQILDAPDLPGANAARERKEVLVEYPPQETYASPFPGTRKMLTILYVPLLADDCLLGVMSIQSDRPQAYGERERLIFRTLCAYGAIALANTDAKEQLNVQKEAAESANLAKSRFLAAASHDLRQPMHTISLLVGLLRCQNRDPEIETIVGKIQSSTLTMGEMFGSLLDISKFDAGAVQTNVRVFEVADLLRWIGSTFEAQATEKGLALRIVGSSAWVDSDPALLERILGNLVSNAICYTDRGEILVGCRRRGTTLSVQVWDSGIGIASAQLGEIFEEFFQVANPERDRSKGLGLGLSIAKRCAQLLGHPLTVRSTPGKGTVFSVELPLAASQSASPAIERSPVTVGSIANAFVVVVEDGAENLNAMEALLQRWGCHTVGASSSSVAIEALQNHLRTPDLIISDYRLRDGLNGIAAIGAIRRWAEHPIPAILITGDMSTTDQLQASDAGFSLLHKPVNADQLRHLAQELLAQTVQPV